MILTLKGADFSGNNIGSLDMWFITLKLTGVTSSNTATSVKKGEAFTTTFTIKEGYTIDENSLFTVNGETQALTWSSSEAGGTATFTFTPSANTEIVLKATSTGGSGGEEEGGEELPTTLTLYKSTPANGLFIMDYQDVFSLQINSTSKTGKFQMIAVDVSAYVGKTLNITATQAVIDGASYSFFTNEILGGYELSSISSLSDLPETSSAGKKKTLESSAIVEKFVVSTTNKVTNTTQKLVPSGAKYLYMTNLTSEQTSEASVTLV